MSDEMCLQTENIRRVLDVERRVEGGCVELLDKDQALLREGMTREREREREREGGREGGREEGREGGREGGREREKEEKNYLTASQRREGRREREIVWMYMLFCKKV